MDNHDAPLIKIARKCIGFLAAVSFCLFAAYTYVTFWRPEALMSENKVLSEAFTKAYSGPAFEVLRTQCWDQSLFGGGGYEQWKISYQQGNVSVALDHDPGLNPCLVYAGEKPGFVIKNNSLQKPRYTVLATGEETEEAYSPTLVAKLLSAVDTGNKEILRQNQIAASWSGSQEGEGNDQ